MAKKKPVTEQVVTPHDDTGKQDDMGKRRQVGLDGDLYRKGGFIAKWKGDSLPDYVNNRLRPLIEEDMRLILEEMGLGDIPIPKK